MTSAPDTRGCSRTGGFAPIADYGVIGDGRTAALVASDGRIDWWPIPTLASPPVCGAILDPEQGGHFALAPREPFDVSRRYVDRTNVLETTYTTASGVARVTDSLNAGTAGRLAWTELARRVEGISGRVGFEWEFEPGNRFGQSRPWITRRKDAPVVVVGDQMMSIVTNPGRCVQRGEAAVGGAVEVTAGDREVVAVVATDNEPLFVPDPAAVDARIDRTIESWQQWCSLIAYDGPWADAVTRSALALKTLLYEPGGAIAAAATTSLPEQIGGERNWDYRYAWVRDSSFTIDALIGLGLHEEVHRAVSWLLGALRRSAPDLHVFYTLSGDVADRQDELPAPGYRGSRPVRAGNAAGPQRQLGTFGDLFATVHRYVVEGHLLDRATAGLLADMADRCCDQWSDPDSGIWELDEQRHYTISKMGCWVALDRATRLAEAGQLDPTRSGRWRSEAAAVHRWVDEHCWSASRRAYTFYAGTDDLDAAVLLSARTGFDRGERLESTIEAITGELARGPLVYRYTGMDSREGAFVACTFWLVEALARTGQHGRAREMMDAAVALTNDVGLLSEQIDPESGAFLGNIPQGLSHLALIDAVRTLADIGGERAGGKSR